MILLVDIGNTRLKWRCYKLDSGRYYGGEINNEEIDVQKIKDTLLEFPIETVYVSSVGKDEIYEKIKYQIDLIQKNIHSVVVKKEMLGLNFVYQDIERLGVDRALAMIGAYDGEGVLVVDAGSAITADYVSVDGMHLGGFILPGLAMTQELLLGNTAKVGVKADLGKNELGTSTESCVSNGFAVLIKSLMQGLIDHGNSLGIYSYILTGGDSRSIEEFCINELNVRENLVLDGLYKYALNREGVSGVLG